MANYDMTKLNQNLLRKRFPNEAKEIIGLDGLSEPEKELLQRCIDHDEFSEEEFKELSKLLTGYREAIKKYKPNETIENVEKVQRVIKTEADFLKMVSEEKTILKINIPFKGELYPVDLEVLPITDSSAINVLGHHIDLFSEYKADDIELFNNAQQGKELSAKEQAVVDKMMKDLENKTSESKIEMTNELLANQTRIVGSDADYETRLKFWEKFPFTAKFAISFKVEELLGLNDSTDALFR